jgi:hypothetical protein
MDRRRFIQTAAAEQVIVEPLPRSLGVDLLVAHGRRPARLGGVFLQWIQ